MNRLVILIPVLLVGCGEQDHPGWLLERPRVLGARVAVEGSAERSSPAPGEAAVVEWLVVEPPGTGPVERAWAFRACVATPPARGLPGCAEPPFATYEGSGPPVVDLRVPAALDPQARVLLAGVLCTGGEPVVGGDEDRCSGGALDETPAFVHVPLAAANHNPSLDEPITLDGTEWSEGTEPPETDCVEVAGGAGLPLVGAGARERTIRIGVGEADREPVGDEREVLQLTHVISDGTLSRQFSVVEEDGAPPAEVGWEPPPLDEIPAGGLTVTFVAVARDGRGGVDWTTRTLCVTQ